MPVLIEALCSTPTQRVQISNTWSFGSGNYIPFYSVLEPEPRNLGPNKAINAAMIKKSPGPFYKPHTPTQTWLGGVTLRAPVAPRFTLYKQSAQLFASNASMSGSCSLSMAFLCCPAHCKQQPSSSFRVSGKCLLCSCNET